MRFAVFSDVHGNALTLDAVVADLERETVDGIVCLGDAIQGGAQPAEVVARLRTLACPVVMGNGDAWLFSGGETEAEAPATPSASFQPPNSPYVRRGAACRARQQITARQGATGGDGRP